MVVTNPFPVPPFPSEVANILKRWCCFVCYHVLGASILLNFNLICTYRGRFAGLQFKGVTAQPDIELHITGYCLQRALSSQSYQTESEILWNVSGEILWCTRKWMPDFIVHANALPHSYCTVTGDIYIILFSLVLLSLLKTNHYSMRSNITENL